MAIKLYKKLLLVNSIYYGHNYINCCESDSDSDKQNLIGNIFQSYEEISIFDDSEVYFCKIFNLDINDTTNNKDINNVINNKDIDNTNNNQNINNVINNKDIDNTNNNKYINNTINRKINSLQYKNISSFKENNFFNNNNNKQIDNNDNNIDNNKNNNKNNDNNINLQKNICSYNEFNLQCNNIECEKNVVNIKNEKIKKTFQNNKYKNASKNINNNHSVGNKKKTKRALSNVEIFDKVFTDCNRFLINCLNKLLPHKTYSYNKFIKISILHNSTIDVYKKYFTSKVCDVIKKTSTKITNCFPMHNQNLYEEIMKKQGDKNYNEIINILNMSIKEFYHKNYICEKNDGSYDKNSPFSNFIEKYKGDKSRFKEVVSNTDVLIEKIKSRNRTNKKSNKSLIKKKVASNEKQKKLQKVNVSA